MPKKNLFDVKSWGQEATSSLWLVVKGLVDQEFIKKFGSYFGSSLCGEYGENAVSVCRVSDINAIFALERGLITRRSLVQIKPPLPIKQKRPVLKKAGLFANT